VNECTKNGFGVLLFYEYSIEIMKSEFRLNPYRWLTIIIAVFFIIGLFLPYSEDLITDKSGTYLQIYRGIDSSTYLLFFILSAIIIGVSFSPWIVIRSLIVFAVLLVMIPIAILYFQQEIDFMPDYPLLRNNTFALYINYLGLILTCIYGFIHFQKSYKKYKEMLANYKKDSSEDLLDSF